MTRRTAAALIYSTPGSMRWARAAASTPALDFALLCLWHWKQATTAAALARRSKPGSSGAG
jgi:hypothetical protein